MEQKFSLRGNPQEQEYPLVPVTDLRKPWEPSEESKVCGVPVTYHHIEVRKEDYAEVLRQAGLEVKVEQQPDGAYQITIKSSEGGDIYNTFPLFEEPFYEGYIKGVEGTFKGPRLIENGQFKLKEGYLRNTALQISLIVYSRADIEESLYEAYTYVAGNILARVTPYSKVIERFYILPPLHHEKF